MAYQRSNPWPHRKMMRKRYANHHTICAILKNLYQDTDDQELREQLATCVTMAKKMHEKLKEYKRKESS